MKLKLEWPLKDVFVTQRFGTDPATYAELELNGHNGVDFRAPHGTPVYASHDGLAVYQVDDRGGHGVVIVTEVPYEDENNVSYLWKTLYWHLVDGLKEPKYKSPFQDKTGFTPVKVGDLIGYADNTGFSNGSHLHYGLKAVTKGKAFGEYVTLNQNNGFKGAINPAPYLPYDLTPFKKIIKYGETSDDVTRLQSFFIRKGYMGPIYSGFGTYGPRTRSAVKSYQIAKGIKHNNGVQVGPLTLEALNAEYDL